MNKKNDRETVERNKAFLKRKMTDRILLRAHLSNIPPLSVRANAYANNRNINGNCMKPSEYEYGCVSITRREWVIENAKRYFDMCASIEDDTIPRSYPTLHFGESIYAGMLGADIKFFGTPTHSYSFGKPIIKDVHDLDILRIDENNPWVIAFKESAAYFADRAAGEFCLQYFISIDALNLVVELMGSTEAYICALTDEEIVRKIMEFGIDYNAWFYSLQKEIYKKNNQIVLLDSELYDLYDKTWYSIDAYTICNPDLYDTMGFDYQQRLIQKCGGGMLHTHGTGLIDLCPKVAKLDGLDVLQLGRDLKAEEYLGIEYLKIFREQAGDLPLLFSLSPEEFENGIRNRTLPGGVMYDTHADTVEQANRMAKLAKDYLAPRII